MNPALHPEILDGFPDNLKSAPGFEELLEIVSRIYDHPALQLDEHVVGKMTWSSLLFTVCFYRALRGLLLETAKQLGLGMQEDTGVLYAVLELVKGELTDKVRGSNGESSPYGPHYVLMREAAVAAGTRIDDILQFVALVNSGVSVAIACQTVGFSSAVTDYMCYSDESSQDFLGALATIAGREFVLAFTFAKMIKFLPNEERFARYRKFLGDHVWLDRDTTKDTSHGDLMYRVLSQLTSEQSTIVLRTMIRFFTLRLRVYDDCLAPGANL